MCDEGVGEGGGKLLQHAARGETECLRHLDGSISSHLRDELQRKHQENDDCPDARAVENGGSIKTCLKASAPTFGMLLNHHLMCKGTVTAHAKFTDFISLRQKNPLPRGAVAYYAEMVKC